MRLWGFNIKFFVLLSFKKVKVLIVLREVYYMKLFSSKLFILALVLFVICSLLIGFSLSTGKLSPATLGAGFILAPAEQAITSVGNYLSDIAGYFYKYDSLWKKTLNFRQE